MRRLKLTKPFKCKLGFHYTGIPGGTNNILKKYHDLKEVFTYCRKCGEKVKII